MPLNQVDRKEGNFTPGRYNSNGGDICGNLLEEYLFRFSKAVEHVVIIASLIFASVFNKGNCAE